MIKDVHYNSVLANRLTPFVNNVDSQGLINELSNMTNSQYRTSVYMLGEKLLTETSSSVYWTFVNALVSFDSKAFLVTLLKGFSDSLKQGKRSVHDDGFKQLCTQCNEIDSQKLLQLLLPLLNCDDCQYLFTLLDMQDPTNHYQHLLSISTLPCAFLLFKSLRYHEHDRAFLVRITLYLIKRGDTLSFNLASLIKAYFGLDEVKNTFSLNLEPYQLSRIDASYDAFCEIMKF